MNAKLKEEITTIWENLLKELVDKSLLCSSEKTLIFQFAWRLRLSQNIGLDEKKIDFERSLFESFSDGTFLDLYFEADKVRVGLEFKFPKKNQKGNSNQTQTRTKIINDVKRLSYLINTDKIDLGVFLLATDETPYLVEGNKKKKEKFKTYIDEKYMKGDYLPIDDKLSTEIVKLCKDIQFKWNGVDEAKKSGKVAWISPIFLEK